VQGEAPVGGLEVLQKLKQFALQTLFTNDQNLKISHNSPPIILDQVSFTAEKDRQSDNFGG